jgi:hypothetical protein
MLPVPVKPHRLSGDMGVAISKKRDLLWSERTDERPMARHYFSSFE